MRGLRIGRGPRRLSLLAGCHADEPVGPRFLRHLASYLRALPGEDPIVRDHTWWIVPHANPDAEVRNRSWAAPGADGYDLAAYLAFAVRELPGDDVEFGFPRGPSDAEARPENRAIHAWWREEVRPFDLHASLHGMAFGAGPWFLLEAAWRWRADLLRVRCLEAVREHGYEPHDVERRGEKGFERLGRGFCTRPDSRAMRAHFVASGDPEMAERFRPSSMEAVRGLGGDPLTLVSEMPLFLTPGVGDEIGPPDPAAERWRERALRWRAALRGHGDRERPADGLDPAAAERVREEATGAGLRPMPVRDQMALQWALIVAGLEQVREERRRLERAAAEPGGP